MHRVPINKRALSFIATALIKTQLPRTMGKWPCGLHILAFGKRVHPGTEVHSKPDIERIMHRNENLVRTRRVELNENGEVVKEKIVWKPESEAYVYKVEGKPDRRQLDCGSASRAGGNKNGSTHFSKVHKVSFVNFRQATSRNMDYIPAFQNDLSTLKYSYLHVFFWTLFMPHIRYQNASKRSTRPRKSLDKKNLKANTETGRPNKKKTASVPVIVISDDEDEVVVVSCRFQGKDPQKTGKNRSNWRRDNGILFRYFKPKSQCLLLETDVAMTTMLP